MERERDGAIEIDKCTLLIPNWEIPNSVLAFFIMMGSSLTSVNG